MSTGGQMSTEVNDEGEERLGWVFQGSLDDLHRKSTRDSISDYLFNSEKTVFLKDDEENSGILKEFFETESKSRSERFYIIVEMFNEEGLPELEEGFIGDFDNMDIYI
jgi:hypothetical protein